MRLKSRPLQSPARQVSEQDLDCSRISLVMRPEYLLRLFRANLVVRNRRI